MKSIEPKCMDRAGPVRFSSLTFPVFTSRVVVLGPFDARIKTIRVLCDGYDIQSPCISNPRGSRNIDLQGG